MPQADDAPSLNGRTPRSVWAINPKPFKEAHFATYPPALVEKCILSGTSEKGCCPECGSPWERVVERESISEYRPMTTGKAKKEILGNLARTTPQGRTCGTVKSTTTGHRPTCKCGKDPEPCTVLDPFFGSGTTGLVAEKLGRRWIGIELNPDYAAMAQERIDRETRQLRLALAV